MSSTRHADPGSPFKQWRFASSPEYDQGLMANLVAMRCRVVNSKKEQDQIWFLQYRSHQPGGLGQVVLDLLAKFPGRLGTKSMIKFGSGLGKTFSAGQVEIILDNNMAAWDMAFSQHGYTAGEVGKLEEARAMVAARLSSKRDEFLEAITPRPRLESGRRLGKTKRDDHVPSCCPAEIFIGVCREVAKTGLAEVLRDFCLDPSKELGKLRPWYFYELPECLAEFRADWIAARKAGTVVTEIGKRVYETLDYAWQGRCLVLIDGRVRTGKTFAAKAWCEAQAGRARCVEVPPGSGDIHLMRVVAESLGVSRNIKARANELRDRIEYVLRTGMIMLILDEAHRLWPERSYRDALPFRVNWVMSLVNSGVPIGLITGQQFFEAQKRTEHRTGWCSEQFTGRLAHYEKLPDFLSGADLEAVARQLLPEGEARAISALADYSQGSMRSIAGIETCVRRARFLAAKAGRDTATTADIKEAIRGSVVPSDSALAAALEDKPKVARGGATRLAPKAAPSRIRTVCSVPAGRLRTGGGEPEMGGHRPLQITETSPVSDRRLAGDLATGAGEKRKDEDVCLTIG